MTPNGRRKRIVGQNREVHDDDDDDDGDDDDCGIIPKGEVWADSLRGFIVTGRITAVGALRSRPLLLPAPPRIYATNAGVQHIAAFVDQHRRRVLWGEWIRDVQQRLCGLLMMLDGKQRKDDVASQRWRGPKAKKANKKVFTWSSRRPSPLNPTSSLYQPIFKGCCAYSTISRCVPSRPMLFQVLTSVRAQNPWKLFLPRESVASRALLP